jgi:hypothetical protein
MAVFEKQYQSLALDRMNKNENVDMETIEEAYMRG